MKIQRAYALLLGMVGIAASTDCSSESTGPGDDTPGPTDLTVTWTFSGQPATAEECMTRKGTKVYLTLSATKDPSLHQSVTEECSKGSVKFSGLNIGKLGMPYLEGILVNEKEIKVDHQVLTVMPMPGATDVTLDFFPVKTDGGAGGSSSSSSSSAASSSSSASSSSAASSSSSSSSSGGGDAGADGG
jgi:hypothetical protein